MVPVRANTFSLPRNANEPIAKLKNNNGKCRPNLISSHENAFESESESAPCAAPSPTRNCNPIVATIVTKATNRGKRRILLFFAKSKFSLNSSTNITLNVAEKAPQPTSGVCNFIPPFTEPSGSEVDDSIVSLQSLLVIDAVRITPPRQHLHRSIFQLPQLNALLVG